MTLILNVKPGDDDYSDTSYLLRQASPYMKIRYTSLNDASDLAPQKRSSASLICQENKKKRKVQKPEVLMAEKKDSIDKFDAKLSAKDDFLNSELQRVSRSEKIMKNLFKALWAFSRQKLLESKIGAKSMRELLSEKDMQITELKKELSELKFCSHKKFPVAEATPVEQNDVVSLGLAAIISASQSNQNDGPLDDLHLSTQLVVEEVSEESACYVPERSSAPMEQSEEELSSDIIVEDIQHHVDMKEMKHHDCPSSSQEANSDTEALSCSHAFVELQGMGAVQKNTEEQESVSGRCESTVKKTIAERDAVGGHRRAGVKDHADMFARVLDGRPPQTKTWTAPVKGCRMAAEATGDEKENCSAEGITADGKEKRQAEGISTDKEGRQAAGVVIIADDKKDEEDLCASSKPSLNTKKTRRRLLPASAMMLKEFNGPHIDAAVADTKRAATDGGVAAKSPGAAAGGRSEKLIRLLKAGRHRS